MTGTAKQAVADYYFKHTRAAMDKSNEEYMKVVSQFASDEGIEASDWKMCSAADGTYADCPVKVTKEGWFGVTVHNPSSVT